MNLRRVSESFGLVIVVAILAAISDSVEGINCVQCSSLEDFRCSEKANPGDLQSLPCYGVQNAQYCVKMTGVFDVNGLDCYQCDSLEDYDCGEKFDTTQAKTVATKCSMPNAKHCIKTTGIFEGQLGTKRFCSDRYLHNFCDFIRRPGDGREYRSCLYTCQGDGCNGAASMGLSIASIIVATLLLLGSGMQ